MAFLRISRQMKETINVERLLKEAELLHQGRKSRGLYKIACQPTPLYDASTDDIRCRARFTEIRVAAYTQRSTLETALTRLKAHILSRYAHDLNDMASTMTERRSMIDNLFRNANEHLASLQTVESTMSLYTEDIDKAGYGLTNSVRILENLINGKGAKSI